MRPMGRSAAGAIGMRLADDDEAISLGLSSDGEEMISVSQQGYGKRSPLKDYPVARRQGRHRSPAHEEDRSARRRVRRVEGTGHS